VKKLLFIIAFFALSSNCFSQHVIRDTIAVHDTIHDTIHIYDTLSAYDTISDTLLTRFVTPEHRTFRVVESIIKSSVKYQLPTDKKDYNVDWSNEISNDTILTSTWSSDTLITVESGGHNIMSSRVWVSNVTLGRHKILNTITTISGREISISFTVIVN